jgi:bifunctional non-homologous end joining protein LigD
MRNLMLCAPGDISRLSSDKWSFEAKHDGNRLMVTYDGENTVLQSRSGRDSTDDYHIDIASEYPLVLDGEVVSLNAQGVPEFNLIQNRAKTRIEYWAFDVLELGGRDLSKVPYCQRREILLKVAALSDGFTVPDLIDAKTGEEALGISVDRGLEGVVAKSLNSTYEYGKRSKQWLKAKN